MTKYEIFKNLRWRTATILKIVFGYNSVADCSISEKFCVRKQFFTEFRHSTELIFVSLVQFGLWRAAAFVSSPLYLFKMTFLMSPLLSRRSQKRWLYAMAMSSVCFVCLSVCSLVRLSVACKICEVIRYVAAPGGERGLIVSTPIHLSV